MAYDFQKDKCDHCGVTKAQVQANPGKFGVSNDDDLRPLAPRIDVSFRLSFDGGAACPKCHREKALQCLMSALDRYASNHGEKGLAKGFGLK